MPEPTLPEPVTLSDTGTAASRMTMLPRPLPTGCTGRRWIGVRRGNDKTATLPQGSPWQERPVFGGTSAPSALAKYHVYEWKGRWQGQARLTPPGDAVSDLKSKVGSKIDRLTEDCAVSGPHLATQIESWHREKFRTQTGASLTLPAGATKIRIAVPDTSPANGGATAIPPGEHSRHGYTMASIARDLSCAAPGSCATISTHLALPHITNEETDPDGGFFGTRGELAEAIYQAVDQWRSNAGTERRLVINLSLGWEPDGQNLVSSTPSDVVLDAIQHAACHGALVIAAAGNHPGGNDVQPGAIYPAAWQSRPFPTEDECRKLEAIGNDARTYAALVNNMRLAGNLIFPPSNVESHLVYAIGGVNDAHEPLIITRPGSLSRFAALGFHGTAGDELPPPLTGTSVAAAVASGTAAAVWSHLPNLSAPEIMERLYATGTPVCTGPTPCAVHEIDRTRAICGAWSQSGGLLIGFPQCSIPIAVVEVPQGVRMYETELFEDPHIVHRAGGVLGGLLPMSDVRSLATPPWTYPQPIEPPCGSACILNVRDNRLYVTIPSTYQNTLSDMTLMVKYRDGSTQTVVPDGFAFKPPGPAEYSFDKLGLSTTFAVEAVLSWHAMTPLGEIGSTTGTITVVQ